MLVIRIWTVVRNGVWDKGYKILIPLWLVLAVGTAALYGRGEENRNKCKPVFIVAMVLNFITIILIVPYTFICPQIAENSLNFYYLTKKNGLFECLLMSDAGYLPLAQRLISIICVKMLNMGTDALYLMQCTGIVSDVIIASAICLFSWQKIAGLALRFSISLLIIALFSHSTVSTFFNFIYLGYLLIILLLICELDGLEKYQYIALGGVSVTICLSKGFYAVFFPFGLLTLVFLGNRLNKRKKIYVICLTAASACQTAYAFFNGGVGKFIRFPRLSGDIGLFMDVLFAVILIVGMFIVKMLKCFWIPLEHKLPDQSVSLLMLAVLSAGSLMIAFAAGRTLSLRTLTDWGNAWYIPFTLAFLILTLMVYSGMSNNTVMRTLMGVVVLAFITVSLKNSANKCHVNNNCVAWSIYKDYFSRTIVPVYKYGERFGTEKDKMLLYYANSEPVDNYEYGAPYKFIEFNLQDDKEYVCQFELSDELAQKSVSAVYVNYIGDVGNKTLYLECSDKDGKIIANISAITPLNSKTVGFILDKNIHHVSNLKVKFSDGRNGWVENNLIVAAE